MPTPSLLDDLNADLLADALAKPAAPRPNEWRASVSWTFTGYLARVHWLTCPSCAKVIEVPEGIYAEETASNGTRRLTQATSYPIQEVKRMEVVEKALPLPCAECLTHLGFTDITSPPAISTNISGEGIYSPFRPKTTLGFLRPTSE